MTVDTIVNWLGHLVTVAGGSALVAYGIFRFLGENWLKHRLAKDIEIAKSEISLLAARKMKLHDREYIVFPEVWARLNRAYASLGGAVSRFKEFTDLSRMNTEEFENWLNRSELSDNERDHLLATDDKNSAYSRILDCRALQRAHDDFQSFHTYFRENRIFISPDIKQKLDKIDDLMSDALMDKSGSIDEHGSKEGRKFMRDAQDKYQKQINPAMDEIENIFQEKIFPEATRGKLLQ